MRTTLTIIAAAGLALAGTGALAQAAPAEAKSDSAKALEVAGVKSAIGVSVTPAPQASTSPLRVDDRVVVSPDEPAPPKDKKGKK